MSDSNVTQFSKTRNAHNDALIGEVRQIMEADSLSQTALSQLTGVGKARLNQWLSGTYKGNVAAVEESVRRWLDSRQASAALEGQMPAAPDWVETPTARAVMSALSFAQMSGSMTAIYGGAGVGKTVTLERYRNHAPNVWVVTATPATASPGSILRRIARALGVRTSGSVDVLEEAIIARLRDTQGLLAIDEAQHLSLRALDEIRQVAEAANVGLALAGNEIVYSQLTGGNRSQGFAQLFSRIVKRVRLSRAKDADVLALLDAWHIQEKSARQLCLGIGRRPGALRGLSQTLRLASMFAATTGAARPTAEHIRDAWHDLGGEA